MTYHIINGWIVEEVGEHTCGTARGGYYGAHEPGCGYEPIVKVEDALKAVALDEKVAAAAPTGGERPDPGLLAAIDAVRAKVGSNRDFQFFDDLAEAAYRAGMAAAKH